MALSAFELQRLEKIKQNQAVLNELFPQEDMPKPSAPKRAKIAKDKSFIGLSEPDAGTRRSSRISGMPAEKSVLDDRITFESRKPTVGYEHPVKTTLIHDSDFFLSVVVKEEVVKIEPDLPSTRSRGPVKIEPVVKAEDLSAISASLRSLSLAFPVAIKVTPQRITTSVWHPDTSKLLLAVADKFGHLGFLDVTTTLDQPDTPHVCLLQPHKSNISGLSYINNGTLLSCSYDGKVKSMDVLTQKSTENDTMLCAISSTPTSIYVGSQSGSLFHIDPRTNTTTTHEISEKKISCVEINPRNPTQILACGLDRHFRVYDSRKMSQSVLAYETGKSCTSAQWDSSGTKIVCVSYDDTVRVFDNVLTTWDGKPAYSMRHNNQTGRWLTNIRAYFVPNTDIVYCANMDKSIEFIQNGQIIARAYDEALTAVTPSINCHPNFSTPVVSGGNGSGKVSIWI